MASLGFLPPLGAATLLLFLVMGLLGMGNGAVFQLLPQRFPREIGVLTGIVGAAGGLGGFLLPNLLGSLHQLTGWMGTGLTVLATISTACMLAIVKVGRQWEPAAPATEGTPTPAGLSAVALDTGE